MSHDSSSPYQERWDRVRHQRYQREKQQRYEQEQKRQEKCSSEGVSVEGFEALFKTRQSSTGRPKRQTTAASGLRITTPTPTRSRSCSQHSIR
jgi:hypothetical protein